MSASEKLKGLDGATPLEKYEIDLFGVLPQIVAVVEAAETYWNTSVHDEASRNANEARLADALSALEEALP